MKRFFQPVAKEGSSKKPALAAADSPTADADGEPGGGGNREPLKFLTWNANSLLLRAKNDWPEFSKLVQSLDPDVICFQEVRMPAAGSKGAPKNPSELKDDTSLAREEKQVLLRALSTPPFKSYRGWWSLSDSKYAGTALLVKRQFQPKKVTFSLDLTSTKHEPDGRVILAEFESFRLLNTYVPNNGWKDDETSFKRRRKWDKRMLDFVLLSNDKPLIWCGDLNVRLCRLIMLRARQNRADDDEDVSPLVQWSGSPSEREVLQVTGGGRGLPWLPSLWDPVLLFS